MNSDTQSWSRRRLLGGTASLAVLGSFAAACQGDANPAPQTPTASANPVAMQSGPGASAATGGVDAELIGSRYRGLKPFAPAPAPPAVKPVTLSVEHPQVFSRVPITDN